MACVFLHLHTWTTWGHTQHCHHHSKYHHRTSLDSNMDSQFLLRKIYIIRYSVTSLPLVPIVFTWSQLSCMCFWLMVKVGYSNCGVLAGPSHVLGPKGDKGKPMVIHHCHSQYLVILSTAKHMWHAYSWTTTAISILFSGQDFPFPSSVHALLNSLSSWLLFCTLSHNSPNFLLHFMPCAQHIHWVIYISF